MTDMVFLTPSLYGKPEALNLSMLHLAIDAHPAFITTELVSFPQNTAFTSHHRTLDLPEHQSSFAIITSLQGSIDIKLNGIRNSIDPSVFAVVNKNSTISISISDERCQPFFLYFRSGPGWKNEDWNITERIYEATDTFKKRIATLLSFRETCSSFVTMQADAIVRSTLAEIVSYNQHSNVESLKLEVKKRSTRTENYKRLATAREWIENNFNQPLSLNNLAGLTSMNGQHFLRQFKLVFHKTPHQYLIDRRIDEARKLLRSNDLSVQEVCSAVGWESVATFTHLFKQRTGVAPGEYRSRSGGDNVL
jgi:AraC-like DNA-binding protein